MSTSGDQRKPIEVLAEELLERRRRGEKPNLQEYIDRYPSMADEIRDRFTAVSATGEFGIESGGTTTSLSGVEVQALGMQFCELGDYRILREIGRGGMGVVYEAEQESLGRRVALKVLSASALLNPKQVRRFDREAKAAARLHHTHIVPVFGVGQQDGHHYYVMQLIAGLGLDVVLDELRRVRQTRSHRSPTFQPDRPKGEGRLEPPARPEQEDDPGLTAAAVARSLITGRYAAAEPPPTDESTALEFSLDDTAVQTRSAPQETSSQSALLHTSSARSTSLSASGSSGLSSLSQSDHQFYQSIARIGLQVAGALEYAHRQGIQHRDIKPSNLLLDSEGNVWVADFGLAKSTDADDLTEAGDIVGTIRYMAPERFQGLCDARSDVYSLGLTLYELVALRPAYVSSDRHSLMDQVLRDQPSRLKNLATSVPQDLETIIHKAIARDPPQRYDTAGALASDLARFLADRPILARRISPWERGWRWCKRNPVVASAVGSAALALIAVAVLSVSYASDQSRAATRIAHLAIGLQLEGQRARDEAQRANAALTESNRRRAMLNLQRGRSACDQGDVGQGLLLMVESLRAATEAKDPALRYTARANLAAWLGDYPRLKAVFSHDGIVTKVAFSPDSKTILTASSDQTARLWDAATGQPIGKPLPHRGAVRAVAFSPDGKTIVTASDDQTARLWVAATQQPIGQLLQHQGPVRFAAFSPDGKTVLTGGDDNTARLWDSATSQSIGQPLPHQGQVVVAAFSPDGKTILTGSQDYTARLWDATTGQPIGNSLQHRHIVYAVAFSPDGKIVLTGSQDWSARLWDAATGHPIGRPLLHQDIVYAVAFSPDGKTILTGSHDKTARLWDLATCQPIGQPLSHQGPVFVVSFSPDGKTALTGSWDSVARLWDTATGQPVGQLLPHQNSITAVAFSPDGNSILTASEDTTARLWESRTAQNLGRLLEHQDGVAAAAFSPDGKTVLTASRDTTARLWDAITGQAIGKPLQHGSWVVGVTYSPGGKTVLTGSWDATAQLWDAVTGQRIGQPIQHEDSVYALAFSPDGGTILTGSDDHTARLSNAATGQPLGQPLRHLGPVRAVAFSPNGKSVLTGSEDSKARLWDAATGRPIGQPLSHHGPVYTVAFSPDGKTALTASQDMTARLWDAATGRPVGRLFQHRGAVRAAAFSPDGKVILTASQDRTARLWDAATAHLIGQALRHQGGVVAVAFSPDGKMVLTGSEDQTARLWDTATGQLIGRPIPHHGAVDAVVFSPDGTRILTGSWYTTARLWNMIALPDDLPRIKVWVEALTGLELNEQGGTHVLDAPTWAGRGQELSQLGGPPNTETERSLDPILFGPDPTSRAGSLVKLGRWSDAEAAFNEAVRARPSLATVWLERGEYYISRGQPEKAAADFAQALDLEPGDRNFYSPRSQAILRLAHWDRVYAKVLELRPRDGHLRTGRGRYHALRSQWNQAAADFARGIASAPPGSEEWFEHACLRLLVGDREGYRNLIRCMQQRSGGSKDLIVASILARSCNLVSEPVIEPEQVIRWAQHAVANRRAPGDLQALGTAIYRAGHFHEAIIRLEEIIARSQGKFGTAERTAQNRLVLAMAYQRLGNVAKARALLGEVRQWWNSVEASKIDGAVSMLTPDWLCVQILRSEAEALILQDPDFPADPFAR